MATLRIADIANQIPQIWSTDLYHEAEKMTMWGRYEGPVGSMMPIIRRDDLNRRPGDTIRVDIALKAQGAGVSGDTPLEGNEEKLRYRQTSMGVTRYKHGFRDDELAEFESIHDLRRDAGTKLKLWLAGKIDDLMWNEVTGNGGTTMPDGNKWASGTASSRATVADTDAGGRLTLADISNMKSYFKTETKVPPFRLSNGEEWYLLFVHPYAALQLKLSSTWQQAQRDAMPRGSDNPVFTGAFGTWDSVILVESDRVPRSTNGSVQVADNVFCGAQLASRGYLQYPSWRASEFDYGTEWGIGVITTLGQKLNVFDLTDAGGAGASALTAVGGGVVYSSAVAPSQP